MPYITDINFFPNETLIKLDNGEELTVMPYKDDGARLTKDEFENMFFDIAQKEIFLRNVDE